LFSLFAVAQIAAGGFSVDTIDSARSGSKTARRPSTTAFDDRGIRKTAIKKPDAEHPLNASMEEEQTIVSYAHIDHSVPHIPNGRSKYRNAGAISRAKSRSQDDSEQVQQQYPNLKCF